MLKMMKNKHWRVFAISLALFAAGIVFIGIGVFRGMPAWVGVGNTGFKTSNNSPIEQNRKKTGAFKNINIDLSDTWHVEIKKGNEYAIETHQRDFLEKLTYSIENSTLSVVGDEKAGMGGAYYVSVHAPETKLIITVPENAEIENISIGANMAYGTDQVGAGAIINYSPSSLVFSGVNVGKIVNDSSVDDVEFNDCKIGEYRNNFNMNTHINVSQIDVLSINHAHMVNIDKSQIATFKTNSSISELFISASKVNTLDLSVSTAEISNCEFEKTDITADGDIVMKNMVFNGETVVNNNSDDTHRTEVQLAQAEKAFKCLFLVTEYPNAVTELFEYGTAEYQYGVVTSESKKYGKKHVVVVDGDEYSEPSDYSDNDGYFENTTMYSYEMDDYEYEYNENGEYIAIVPKMKSVTYYMDGDVKHYIALNDKARIILNGEELDVLTYESGSDGLVPLSVCSKNGSVNISFTK